MEEFDITPDFGIESDDTDSGYIWLRTKGLDAMYLNLSIIEIEAFLDKADEIREFLKKYKEN